MINIDTQTYPYPVLGVPGAYLPPHDEFELRDYKFSKTSGGNMLIEGVMHLKCDLLKRHIERGLCGAYLLARGPGKVYRKCKPIKVGSFSLTLEGAAIYADLCKIICVVAAKRDIPNFFHPEYHNAEYNSRQLEVKRSMPVAVSYEIHTRKKVDSVGSAIRVRADSKLNKKVSFTIECGPDKDYIDITARPETKRQIDIMHKTDRALFDNVILAPVLVHAFSSMEECKESAQWASALAEKCEAVGIGPEEIDERPHVAAQKLLHADGAALFERLKWDKRSGRRDTAVGGGTGKQFFSDPEEDDYY